MKKMSLSILFFKRSVTFLIAIFLYGNLSAQNITNYSFAASNGTFTALTGATSPSLSAGTVDEGYFNAIPLGFDFWYMGNRYTNVSASTNGWLTLGANITDAATTNNLLSGGTPRPVIAPLWDDVNIQATTNFSYQTSGTTGSRICTIQFLNCKWGIVPTAAAISFQVKLYEATGKIDFIYRRETGTALLPSASVGLSATATGSGSFLSLNGTGTSPTVSSTTETNNLGTKPATGQVYTFTPPVPVAPVNLTFTSVSSTSTTLNWQDFSSNEMGFVVYRSTDGINYTFISQTTANATSSIQSALSAGTMYYWKVYAVSEGGLSGAIYGSQATLCSSTPSAPIITSPVTYCQNSTAVALTATGSNLLWGAVQGSIGGNNSLTSGIYIDASFNNRKVNFTTNTSNVIINTIDYYIPAYQAVSGLVLSLYNSSGTLIATSVTNTTLTTSASTIKITNLFNYTITTAGDYSIGVSAGSGTIGYDNPSLPITETTNTISITGLSSAGNRCFSNMQFAFAGSSSAPVPSTATVGSTIYYVTQTVSGCTSSPAAITVNVTASPNIAQIPTSNIIANYKMEGNANDATGNNAGTLQNAPTTIADRFGNAGKAYSFDGSSQYISTAKSYVSPANFTISIWFKTVTTTGGKLIGFGSAQTGLSGQYDRHIYMNNAGQLYFGVYPGAVKTVNSALSYNDNNWHFATATLSSVNGMVLYVDGTAVASDPTTTTAEGSTGYWRIGYDNNNGWTSQPTSYFFSGVLDDALIYQQALTATEVQTLYTSPDGAGNNGPVCIGSSITLSATTVAGATYSWTGPNSFTSSLQNPSFAYAAANAGVYTLQVTANGCTSKAYTTVISTTNAGQWTGNVSTDWANAANWCSGVLPTSTTNVIISSSATRMPSIGSSVNCNNLTVNAGATLTLTAAGTLNIAGTFTNNGTVSNGGTTNFNGTSGQQTFAGLTSFNNLTLSNTSGLLLPVAVTVNNNLTLTAGTLNANNFALTVGGNWINNVSTTAFTAGTATVTFNGTAAQSIGGTFTTTFNNLTIATTASTVTLAINTAIAGNLSVSTGTLDLATFTANRATAGGTLTVSNNALLKIGGTNTFPTNYITNTLVVASTVEYSGTNQTVANQTYGNLTFSSGSGAAIKTLPATAMSIVGNLNSVLGSGTSVTYTAAANITIGGNVSIGASTIFNGSSFSISAGGNWTNNGTFNGNTGTVVFAGPGATIGGSGTQNFSSVTVSASQVNFANVGLNLSGNLATISSGSFSQASGGTLTMTGATKTISGSGISIDNLVISGSVSTTSSLTLTGNLTVSGTFSASTGTTTMTGAAKTISSAGSKTFSSLTIAGSITTSVDFTVAGSLTVSGSITASAGAATFSSTSSLSGTANLFNVIINGTSLQLSATSNLGVAGVMTITAGVLNTASSTPNTVNFNGNGAQTINNLSYNNLVFSTGGTKTAAGAITVNNSLTISAATTFIPGTYTHSIYVSWNNYGTFTAGASTIQFLGAQNSNIIGATTFNILTVNNTNATTGVYLQNNVSAATVNMTNGTMFTGTNTLTITTTRNGNGIILGNIKRTHAFSTGVAYAFEGPNNTITFTAVTSVTTITVSVQKKAVSDFPYNASINREYNISIPSGTYTATLRLHYEDEELNGNTESTMGMWNYDGTYWIPFGTTSNSTTSNYVEKTLLTDITNRWTCGYAQSVAQWNGSVSSDWNTAANWTVLLGSASKPPSASDVVALGTAAFANQPTISTSVNVKNIVFGGVQPVTLSMASGGTLNTGDMLGIWDGNNATHAFNVNNQSVTINGGLTLSDGTANHVINMNIGTGTVNLNGSLNQSGGANVIFSGSGNLNITNDYNKVNGTFTPATGTVTYNGTENQVVAAVNYNNLTINNAAATPAINNNTTITGNLTITAGHLENNAVTTIGGNVTISSGATFYNTNILHIRGNWANSGTYASNGAATNVIFEGTANQTISTSTFNNLEFNKPVGSIALLTGDVTLDGNLVGTSGTLDIGTYFFNRDVAGGSATMSDSATLIIGTDNAPNKFSSYYMAPNSTVIFNGMGAQHLLLPGMAYGNLIFRNSGTKTLYSSTTVNGNLTIENGATFDAMANTITLNGSWINSGTFTSSASTLVCKGVGKVFSGNTTFKRLSIYGTYTFLNNNTIDSLLVINPSGSLTGGSSITTTMNGDLVNKGILYTLGTTTFTGNVLQTLSLINAVQTVAITVNFNGSISPVLHSTSAPQYGYLNINNTGGVNPSVGWTIAYGLTVGAGASFNGGNSTHNILGYVTNNGIITSTGTMNFIPSAAATINLGSNFNSTGNVFFGGAAAITLNGNSVDSFYNVTFANTHASGVSPSFGMYMKNDYTVNNGSVFNAGTYTHYVGGNFVNNGTINSATSTFIFNGTDHQDMYNSSALNNVTINKNLSFITLFSNTTVNGNLNFIKGKIHTDAYAITQGASSTVSGASQNTGWVNGNLVKIIAAGATVKTFEIGDSTVYAPATLTFANVTTAGTLKANCIAADHPNFNSSSINATKSVNRYWRFINTGIAFTIYGASFRYPPADIDAGSNIANFGVGLYTGSNWLYPTTTTVTDSNAVIIGANTFGDIAIGEICNKGTTISYGANPYCAGAGAASVTLTGMGGGTFTSAAGLSINASTGYINLSASTPGSYTVKYSITATSACGAYITTANITINPALTATVNYNGAPFCNGGGTVYPTGVGTAGGLFSSSSGLIINATTGAVDLSTSTAGTYTVTYTIAAAGGCTAFSTTTSITINPLPTATIAYTNSPYCANASTATVTFTGTTGGVYSSTQGLAIDPSSGIVDISNSILGSYIVTYTVAAAGGCSQFQTTATLSIVNTGTWSGAVNTSWNTSGNWICGAIPDATTNVTIPSGLTNYPILNTGTGTVQNITIQNGATLIVNAAKLRIGGSISNSGTITATTATIEMNGTIAQTIPVATFAGKLIKNLIINNTNTVTLLDTIKITADLIIQNGSLATGGFLVLKSSDTATARVATITSLASNPITGNVMVERYIPGRRKYRLITSAVTTSTNSTLTAGQENLSIWGNWQNGGINTTANVGELITGGTAADGYDQGTTNASLYTYNDVNRAYVGFTSANGKNTKYTPLKAGIAYLMFVYGDRQNSVFATNPHNTVLNTFGTLKTGDQAYTTSSSIPLTGVNGRFTLLGNPFASPIDWTTIPKTNLANTYWGWDPNLSSTGGYITVTTVGTVTIQAPYSGSTGLNQYIQSGQGFYVKTTGASPTLTIREQDKVSNFNANAYREGFTAATLPLMAINLQYMSSGTKVLADGVLSIFDDSFSNAVTADDATKMDNTAESIAIQNDTSALSIDARLLPKDNDTIFLAASRLTKPQYILQVFTEHMGDKNVLAFLQDTYLNTLQSLSLTDTNNIIVNVNTGIPASFAINRFRIIFKSSLVILPLKFISIKAAQKNTSITVNWETGDEGSVQKYVIERSADGINFYKVGESASRRANNARYEWIDNDPAKGINYYRIRAMLEDGKFLLSSIAEVKMSSTNTGFKIYPNPVINYKLNIRADEMAKGNYILTVRNRIGQLVLQRIIEHSGGTFSKVTDLNNTLPAGTYFLQIIGNDEKYDQTIIIQ